MSERDAKLLKFVVAPFAILLVLGLGIGMATGNGGGSPASTTGAAPEAQNTPPAPASEQKAAARLDKMLRVNWRGLYAAAIPRTRVDRPIVIRKCNRHDTLSDQQGYDCTDTSLNSWHIEISTDWYSASAWSLWVRWLKPQMTFCDPSCGGVAEMGG